MHCTDCPLNGHMQFKIRFRRVNIRALPSPRRWRGPWDDYHHSVAVCSCSHRLVQSKREARNGWEMRNVRSHASTRLLIADLMNIFVIKPTNKSFRFSFGSFSVDCSILIAVQPIIIGRYHSFVDFTTTKIARTYTLLQVARWMMEMCAGAVDGHRQSTRNAFDVSM